MEKLENAQRAVIGAWTHKRYTLMDYVHRFPD